MLQYSNVWEDFEFIASTTIHDNVISIASAGDNILNILSLQKDFHPTIHAIDMDHEQLECLRKTIQSIQTMNRNEFLAFIGYSSSGGYKTTGRLEIFLDKIRKYAAEINYDETKVKQAFKQLFSSGRDESKLKYVISDINEITERMYSGLIHSQGNEYTNVLKNPNLSIIPYVRYMTEEGYEIVKHNLTTYPDSVIYVHSDIQTYLKQLPAQMYTFILSDIFEYMSQDETDDLFNDLDKISCTNSTIIYWCMLVARDAKRSVWQERITGSSNDRIFFYQSRHLLFKP